MQIDTSQIEHMIQYIKAKVLRQRDVQIDADTPLVSSGMVDSFSLIDTLLELEKLTHRRISARLVEAEDMDTVRKMLQTAERVGKLRRE